MNRLCVLLLVSLFVLSSFAQKSKCLYGLVKDNTTQETLYDVLVKIYSDTTLIAETQTSRYYNVGSGNGGFWFADVPAEGGIFRFTFHKEGYDDIEKTMTISPFKKLEQFKVAFNVSLQRSKRDRVLGAAVVKATQVKFYHKGDTIVYNADAFQLAEGSMLDNLIKSMPGAELSDDGEITVNGKHVDALLLNGEDFFKGKNKIMLENLPAYMVRNIKVYDRLDPLQQALGRRDGDYVLDVNLKKQYSIGLIGNVEAGYGSKDRYLARLFALRFTDASRVSVYANFNNLNDTRKPGETSNWTPETMPTGLLTQKAGGLDYLIKPKHSMKKFSGNAEVEYVSTDNYTETTTENYFAKGNTFQRNRAKARSGSLTLNTNHSVQLLDGDGLSGVFIMPRISYNRYHRDNNSIGATFASDPSVYADSRAVLDSINTMRGDNLRRLMLNRYARQSKYEGWRTDGSLWILAKKQIDGVSYAVNGEVEYMLRKNDSFEQYHLQYPNLVPISSVFQNTYTHDIPNRKFAYSLNPYVHFNINRGASMQIHGILGQEIIRRKYSRHNLDALIDWAEGTIHEIGELPSEREFLINTMDMLNSYDKREYDNWQEVRLNYQYYYYPRQKTDRRYWTGINVTMPVTFHHNRLDYARGSVYDGITHRNTVLLNPNAKVWYMWKERQRMVEFNYSLAQTSPAMTTLIDIEDSSEPLNTYQGNSYLRNSSRHNATALYQDKNTNRETIFSTKMSYNVTTDAIAYAYTYDRTTGKRYYKPRNVDGNYLLSADINYSRPLDKRKRLTLNTITHARLDHGVDYISEDAAIVPLRSSVNTWWGTETMRLTYKLGKHTIGAKGYLGIGHVTSSRADFDAFTICDFNYGLTTTVKMPQDFELSTDLTMYSHRGYATGSSNTNDLVWNARLTKSLPKLGLVFMLDGFDILNQLSNITQVINSQGRTETYRNSLPRYIMAHVIYRLNKKPKKK